MSPSSVTSVALAAVVAVVSATPPDVAAAAGAAAPPPATGVRPALTVDDAMKELDLIRPSRPKVAQDFALATHDGKTFRLSEHRGKVLLVNFWATWCAPCREEMPAMEQLYRAYRDRGLAMVGVSVDASGGPVGPFVREHRLSFPIVLDPKMETANAYGVRALPATFIVDRQGTLVALALGPRAWDNRAARALVEGLAR